MSDSVSNAQVQDVLSSIRRLVSEEGRAPKPLAPVERPEPAGRLVLTPSLRVSNDAAEEGTEAEAATASEAGPDDQTEVAEAKQWPPADDDPCWEEFVQAAVEQEQSTPEPEPEATEPSEDWPEPSEDVAQTVDAVDVEESPAPEEAEDLASQPENDDASEENEASDDVTEAPQEAETASEDKDTPAEPLVLDAAMKETPAASPTEALAAKIAALEAVIGRTPDQWEPDGTGADDYSGTSVGRADWDDQTAEDVEPETEEASASVEPAVDETKMAPPFVHRTADPQDDPEQEDAVEADLSPDAKDAAIGLDEGVIDEEMLRDLVGDIVRQELQGALGERITRNVRKLVRREIQRALTAKELE